jgi:hypothetical protein
MLLQEGQKLLLECAPPMALLLTTVFIRFCRAVPPMKGQRPSCSGSVIRGRRSLVLKTQWSQELMYDMGLIQPSLRDGRWRLALTLR